MAKTETEKIDPDELANAALSELIGWANETRGAKAAVLQTMQERCLSPINRAMVERWLLPDPKKRMHPRFGMGLLLVNVMEDVRRKWKPTATEPKE